jgi:hypothetical protein
VEADALRDPLDERRGEMARRALDLFVTVFPETASWDERDRSRFVDQARSRFEAILAVASQGAEVDEALTGDLQEVGATAAWSGSVRNRFPEPLSALRAMKALRSLRAKTGPPSSSRTADR